jgi:charged multivesicular body protein 1
MASMTSLKIRMSAKALENDAKRFQKQAAQERAKAKAELARGNRATAALYAQNAVRFEQQANSLLQHSATTTGMGTEIRMAEVTAQTAQTMKVASSAMQHATKQVNLEQLAKERQKMDGLKQQMGAAHELITNGEGEMEVNAGAEDLLAQLDEENNQIALLQIADIPEGIPGFAAPGQATRTTAH